MRAEALPPGPGPRKKSILGSLEFYWRFATDPIAFVRERFERYGDIYYAPSDGVPLYVLRHPEHIGQVLLYGASKFSKSHSAFRRLSEVVGEGLLTSDGEAWKRQRRMVQPAFTKARMRAYAEVMTDEALRTAKRWEDAGERDISREMIELTLRVVTRALFDHDAGGEGDRVASSMRRFNAFMGRPTVLPAAISPTRIRMRRAVAGLDEIIYGLIAQRRGEDARGRVDLLQSLIDAVDDEGDGGRMTEREVRDQLVTMYLAGHETTSHALTWTWCLLSRNPQARDKLRAELSAVLGGRAPTYDDLERLPYTEYVLKESMRLYPPAYVVARKAVEDTEIGGYPVPAGSEVVIWIYMTHHDPRWYPQPEIFRPERFDPAVAAERPKLSYLPFGAGPRACIGAQFSLLESRLVLATLAQRFLLDVAPGHRVALRPGVTLVPRGGMPMSIRTA